MRKGTTWQLQRGKWQIGKVAAALGDRGRSRKRRRRCGGGAAGAPQSGLGRAHLLAARGRSSRRAAQVRGLRRDSRRRDSWRSACSGGRCWKECPRAPELQGAGEGPVWASSYLRLGCCSSPGSQQVSRGEMGSTLGPRRLEAIVAALQSWPQAGQRRPGLRSGGSWHGRQDVRGLDSFTCANLLFSSFISPWPLQTVATKKETSRLPRLQSLGTF